MTAEVTRRNDALLRTVYRELGSAVTKLLRHHTCSTLE
jgi:hypothetical protein